MPAHRTPRAPGRSGRSPAVWLLLPLILLAGACGSDSTGPGEEEESVEGLWTTTVQNLTYYVDVTSSTVRLLEGSADACFNEWNFAIVSRNENTFTLRETESGAARNVTIRAENGQIRVSGLTSGTLALSAAAGTVPAFDACEIEGRWEGPFDHVVIEDGRFTVYTQVTETCFDVLAFDLVVNGGHTYTLEERYGSNAINVQIINRAGELAVVFSDGGVNDYTPSSDDPATFPVCGGGDNAAVTCSALPALTLGEAIEGELTIDDPLDPDFDVYYDLYGLTLESSATVTLGESSDSIDPFLRLWAADGGFIAANDDISFDDTDSSLTITLEAACYIVEASSWGGQETGPYTLTAD